MQFCVFCFMLDLAIHLDLLQTFKVQPQNGRTLKINFELPKLQLAAIYTHN